MLNVIVYIIEKRSDVQICLLSGLSTCIDKAKRTDKKKKNGGLAIQSQTNYTMPLIPSSHKDAVFFY